MRVVAVIQARMGSSRLPGKVLAPLAGEPLLKRLIARVRPARRLDGLIVATSQAPADDAVAAVCAATGTACFRGSETDVLGRFIAAADSLDADIAVRLTGDNPAVDASLVDYVLDRALPHMPPAVYVHNVDDSGFPRGLYVEAATMAALRTAAGDADDTDREHVTWHLRRRPEAFPAVVVKAPGRFAEVSLTVDTHEDLRRLNDIFRSLYRSAPDFDFRAFMVAADPAAAMDAKP